MKELKYFVHQIKRTKGVYEKGIVVKDTLEDAKQTYHAYLGAYAYNNHKDKDTKEVLTDFVSAYISNTTGMIDMHETWEQIPVQKPEPEPTPEPTPEPETEHVEETPAAEETEQTEQE